MWRLPTLGFVWSCVLAILSVGPHLQGPAPGWCAGLGVRVRPRDIEDELAVADHGRDLFFSLTFF